MAEQRQPFRFRLPWQTLQTTQTPRPTPPWRPSVETQRPAQPTAAVPPQRPPFRPAGIAPVQPPPSSPPQAPQRTETPDVVQPAASTAPSTTQTQAALPSPSRTATQPRAAASVPPTPSSATPLSQVASVSQTQPAPQATSQPASQTTSQPSSPARTANQLQPTGTTKLQPTIQESSQPTPTPTQPQTSEQEPKSVVSQQLSQEPQSKAQVLPSETVSKSQIEPRAPEQEPKSTVSQEPQSKAQVLPSETVSKSQTEPRTSEQEPKATVSQQLSQEPQSKAQVLPSETVSKSQTEPRTSEQEPKAVVSQQLSQEPQSKAQVLPSETVSKSQTEPRTSEQVPKPAVSQQLSQEPQSKVQVLPSETVSKSQTEPQTSKQEPKPVVSQQPSQEPQSKAQVLPSESSSQPNGAATQPTKVSPTSTVATETVTPPQKLDSNAIGGDAKPLPERKLEESERGKKVVPEIIEEEKTSGPAHEEPTKSTVTELLTAETSASVAKAKDLLSAAFPGKQTQKEEKEEAFDRKEAVVIQEQRTGKQMDTASSIQPAVISNREQLPLHEEARKDIFKFVQNLSTGQSTAANSVSVITLAGENRGASMHLGLEPAKKEGYVHIHRGYKLNPDESTEATTDGEESSKAKKSKDPVAQNPPLSIYINSNIQSVNNSISFDSSVAERNPGVSLVVSDNQEEPIKSNGQPMPLETRRAEFNVTPAEKLTYDPTVRRRCLRGLFMEPSDSDPDNPEKPRRHGCRYNDCAEKDKDKEIGIH